MASPPTQVPSRPVTYSPVSSPTYSHAESNVNNLQTSVRTSREHLEELQSRLAAESALHDGPSGLHAQMKNAEKSVFDRAQALRKLGVDAKFKAGQQERGPSLFKRPRLSFRGKVDPKYSERVDRLKDDFREYKDKWTSHAGSNVRLEKASKAIERQQKSIDRIAKSLAKAQDALAKATEAQALQAAKAARAETPGYFELQRQIKQQKEKTRLESAQTKLQLKETQVAITKKNVALEQQKREEKERKESEKTQRKIDKENRATAKTMERLRKKESEAKKAPAFSRSSVGMRRPEVHVNDYRRRSPRR